MPWEFSMKRDVRNDTSYLAPRDDPESSCGGKGGSTGGCSCGTSSRWAVDDDSWSDCSLPGIAIPTERYTHGLIVPNLEQQDLERNQWKVICNDLQNVDGLSIKQKCITWGGALCDMDGELFTCAGAKSCSYSCACGRNHRQQV